MICKYCGKEIADDSAFCPECGQTLGEEVEKPEEETPSSKAQAVSAPGEPHMACVLLLDSSYSMNGKAMDSLNKAINMFQKQTALDELAQKRIDIAIIEFNEGARVVQEFTPLSQMKPVRLVPTGETSMGAGINLAIDKVKERNRFYASMGTPCFKPWIFMITDGEPTDDISVARDRIREEESKGRHGKLKFWAVGVGDYSEDVLKSLTNRCISLDEANFEGIFNWLSESMVAISVSRVGEEPEAGGLPKGANALSTEW